MVKNCLKTIKLSKNVSYHLNHCQRSTKFLILFNTLSDQMAQDIASVGMTARYMN